MILTAAKLLFYSNFIAISPKILYYWKIKERETPAEMHEALFPLLSV